MSSREGMSRLANMSGTRGREATGVALPEDEGRSAEAVETECMMAVGVWKAEADSSMAMG